QLLQGSGLSVQRSHVIAPEWVTGKTDLNEGDEAQTGPDSQSFIQLFDGSTVHTYFDTSLRIERLRTSQFFSSLREANLFLSTGTLVLATAKLSGFSDATYTVATDDAVVNVKPDSTVRVEVD